MTNVVRISKILRLLYVLKRVNAFENALLTFNQYKNNKYIIDKVIIWLKGKLTNHKNYSYSLVAISKMVANNTDYS